MLNQAAVRCRVKPEERVIHLTGGIYEDFIELVALVLDIAQ